MGLLMCLLMLLLCAQVILLTSSQAVEKKEVCKKGNQNCPKCPPGQFLKNCGCVTCPTGTFTSDKNCEPSCHRCYSDCTSGSTTDLHLRVVQNCSQTSNVRCECEKGFYCVASDSASGNCKTCERSQLPTPTEASTWTQRSSFPKGSPESIMGNATDPRTDQTKTRLIVILCPLLIIGVIALGIIFCFGCPGHETRFKQTMKKLCSVEAKEAAHITRETFCEKQQTVPMATANMGPVHVHNPGTVIFSLLGEFSGQIGETKEEKTDVQQPSGDEEYCTVCQPTPSPTVPFSEEEHPGELHNVFFPSQEQGKDCRVSMEEQL